MAKPLRIDTEENILGNSPILLPKLNPHTTRRLTITKRLSMAKNQNTILKRVKKEEDLDNFGKKVNFAIDKNFKMQDKIKERVRLNLSVMNAKKKDNILNLSLPRKGSVDASSIDLSATNRSIAQLHLLDSLRARRVPEKLKIAIPKYVKDSNKAEGDTVRYPRSKSLLGTQKLSASIHSQRKESFKETSPTHKAESPLSMLKLFSIKKKSKRKSEISEDYSDDYESEVEQKNGKMNANKNVHLIHDSNINLANLERLVITPKRRSKQPDGEGEENDDEKKQKHFVDRDIVHMNEAYYLFDDLIESIKNSK